MPTDLIPFLAIIVVTVTDPAGNQIFLNPREIVSLRVVTGVEAVADGANCLIGTLDSKKIAIREQCREVLNEIMEETKKAVNH
jgi:hypothetical protein